MAFQRRNRAGPFDPVGEYPRRAVLATPLAVLCAIGVGDSSGCCRIRPGCHRLSGADCLTAALNIEGWSSLLMQRAA